MKRIMLWADVIYVGSNTVACVFKGWGEEGQDRTSFNWSCKMKK